MVEAPNTVEGVCRECGEYFQANRVMVGDQEIMRQLYCSTCTEAEIERREMEEKTAARKRQDRREAGWAEICAYEYRTTEEGGATDAERLAAECPMLPAIEAWTIDRKKGLLVHGETGARKTRAVWRLLRRLWKEGRSIRAMTSGEFGRQYADAAGSFTRSAWFDDLVNADVVFLDDLGKSEWTVGAWGEFFDLMESRMKKGFPLIITTNETSKTLKVKVKDENTLVPLCRRMGEMERITLK